MSDTASPGATEAVEEAVDSGIDYAPARGGRARPFQEPAGRLLDGGAAKVCGGYSRSHAAPDRRLAEFRFHAKAGDRALAWESVPLPEIKSSL